MNGARKTRSRVSCWRREFLQRSAAVVSSLGFPRPLRGSPPSRPNILLILADDMGFSDIGCYGGEIRTPGIDRLGRNGLRFTQFYNSARCCPTRASLLTGLHPHQAGVGHMLSDRGEEGYRGDLNESCVTIAEVLRQAGYSTSMSGKWHVTRFLDPEGPRHNWPRQRGFDRFFGTLDGAGSFYDPVSLTLDNDPIRPDSATFYYTDAISDWAVRFLQEHHEHPPQRPFFLYLAYTAPHWPLHAPEQDVARCRGRYAAGWDQIRDQRFARQQQEGIVQAEWDLSPRDPEEPPWEQASHREWQKRRMEVYAAQLERMDQGIGRVLSWLERSGRWDDTLIFFLSDNGGCAEVLREGEDWLRRYSPRQTSEGRPGRIGNIPGLMPGGPETYQSYGIAWANASNTPFRLYKHWVHEGGIATPFIVHWPARIPAAGQLRHQPAHLVDLMATCLDAAQTEYPTRFQDRRITLLEGVSLLPAFDDDPLPQRALYFEHEGNRAVRQGRWKLVARSREGPWELYDMQADRTETRNLAGEVPDKVQELASQWTEWARRARVLPWPSS